MQGTVSLHANFMAICVSEVPVMFLYVIPLTSTAEGLRQLIKEKHSSQTYVNVIA